MNAFSRRGANRAHNWIGPEVRPRKLARELHSSLRCSRCSLHSRPTSICGSCKPHSTTKMSIIFFGSDRWRRSGNIGGRCFYRYGTSQIAAFSTSTKSAAVNRLIHWNTWIHHDLRFQPDEDPRSSYCRHRRHTRLFRHRFDTFPQDCKRYERHGVFL